MAAGSGLLSTSSHQLLRRSPERRLGAGERDAEEVKKHLFFRVRNKSRTHANVPKAALKKLIAAATFCPSEYGLERAVGQEGEAAVHSDHSGPQRRQQLWRWIYLRGSDLNTAQGTASADRRHAEHVLWLWLHRWLVLAPPWPTFAKQMHCEPTQAVSHLFMNFPLAKLGRRSVTSRCHREETGGSPPLFNLTWRTFFFKKKQKKKKTTKETLVGAKEQVCFCPRHVRCLTTENVFVFS